MMRILIENLFLKRKSLVNSNSTKKMKRKEFWNQHHIIFIPNVKTITTMKKDISKDHKVSLT
jgi:hypothetical protein